MPLADRPAVRSALPRCAAALACGLLLAGCAAPPISLEGRTFPPQEQFNSGTTYSRLFDAAPGQTCEAARRALLSQGYIIQSASNDLVEGRKNFQPDSETHVQMTIRVVCVPESANGRVSLGFVTALQDRYALKKMSSSASLGVGALGSVSLPVTAVSDSLVRVGSETITTGPFYESFFDLVKQYLVLDAAASQPS